MRCSPSDCKAEYNAYLKPHRDRECAGGGPVATHPGFSRTPTCHAIHALPGYPAYQSPYAKPISRKPLSSPSVGGWCATPRVPFVSAVSLPPAFYSKPVVVHTLSSNWSPLRIELGAHAPTRVTWQSALLARPSPRTHTSVSLFAVQRCPARQLDSSLQFILHESGLSNPPYLRGLRSVA